MLQMQSTQIGLELAFTALVSGNLGILVPDEKAGEDDICRVFIICIHVSLYTPLAFGVQKNGAHLAVVGHGRDVANAKYSDRVRINKPENTEVQAMEQIMF
nr:D-aminoacid aminotransferase-like PLP-dependent enzymes superfamily protein [Tanacetum cinerariifolium]